MPFKFLIAGLVTVSIEKILNTFLYRSSALKATHQRLNGKVLRISLKEISIPLVLVFNELHLDVLNSWEIEADCSVFTNINMLITLFKNQRLASLSSNNDVEIEGDFHIVQNFIELFKLAEFDLFELIAPYIGDIATESISKLFRCSLEFLYKEIQHQHRYITNAIIEEWQLAPGTLEVAWFIKESASVKCSTKELIKRIEKLEEK